MGEEEEAKGKHYLVLENLRLLPLSTFHWLFVHECALKVGEWSLDENEESARAVSASINIVDTVYRSKLQLNISSKVSFLAMKARTL